MARALDQAVARVGHRPAEARIGLRHGIVAAVEDQDRRLRGGEPVFGQHRVGGTFQNGGETGRIARAFFRIGQQGRDLRRRGRRLAPQCRDKGGAGGFRGKEVVADAAQHQTPVASGAARLQLQQQLGAEREADGAMQPRGQLRRKVPGEVGIVGRVMRAALGPVARDRHPDRIEARRAQSIAPAIGLPGGRERPAPAVDQRHPFHAGTPRAASAAAFRSGVSAPAKIRRRARRGIASRRASRRSRR